MNWVDWVILAVAAVSIVSGALRGAVRTIFSLAGVIVGFIVASRESGAVGIVISRWIPENVAAVAGFVFVFLGISIVFALTGWLFRKVLQGLLLGWVDRVGGGAMGLIQATMFLGVLALVVEGLGPFRATRDSATYPYALEAGKFLLSLVPEETRERLDWESLKDRVPKVDDLI